MRAVHSSRVPAGGDGTLFTPLSLSFRPSRAVLKDSLDLVTSLPPPCATPPAPHGILDCYLIFITMLIQSPIL